ncbi:DNA-directed RNA polymerase subunit beta, partial [bacterium]|nr:DNA-directed RNA polymerase subunit beta [bacterium]
MSKASTATCPWRERKTFAKIKSVIDMPDLIETQQRSYSDFLQQDSLPSERMLMGLEQAFGSIFPVGGRDGSSLEFVDYTLGRPKYDMMECIDRGMTYSAPLRIKVRLVVRAGGKDKDEEAEIVDIREEDIYLGEIPLMTDRGTFIINGAERVVVSQLHRSPGATFNVELHHSGQRMIQGSIIPNRGAWLEFENDLNDVLSVIIDRRRKLPCTVLLRAFGIATDDEIMSLFLESKDVKVSSRNKNTLVGKLIYRDCIDPETNSAVVEAGTEITEAVFDKLTELKIPSVSVVEGDYRDFNVVRNTLLKDNTTDRETALAEIYQTLRPGEPPAPKNALTLFENLFTKARRYDLSRVGRYRINKKLGLKVDTETVTLMSEDVVGVVKYILYLNRGEGASDDIDHLGNRRVRTIGELLENQIRVGLARMERTVREKMGILDLENIMPRNLINAKPITTAIADFFGRSQLSQFLDQVNPLSELTHKRRLSALGPGGLNRERAGFEVRDVHHTHYGRVCPIETPEGPNIGLISSLSTYARVNEFGFIETPYRSVKNGKVSNKIDYLSADDEDICIIAQANAPIDGQGKFVNELVLTRYRENYPRVSPEQVNYMDVSPLQLVSISAALIPFLEHDDANRALMGSNMQ